MQMQDKLNEKQEGIYYGPATNDGQPILKPWKPDKEKNSPNVFVLGVSGAGMSITDKYIALMEEYAKGSRIIFIDPMSEYQNLCENLDGDFINADGDKNHSDNSDLHLFPEKEVSTWK